MGAVKFSWDHWSTPGQGATPKRYRGVTGKVLKMVSALLSSVATHTDALSLLSETHERQRHLSDDAVQRVRSLGILRSYVPAVYGGPEFSPAETMAAVRLLSAADAATGWCANIASLTSHLAGSVDPEVARTVFGDPASAVCGAYAPNGVGTKSSDGSSFAVTGRWAWGSGSSFASWMTAGTICDDGTARHMIIPKSSITMHDTWDASGLRGTASHDFSVTGVNVLSEFSSDMVAPRRVADAAICRVPLFVLFSGGVASVMLGIARRAIDEIITLSQAKKPMQSSKTLSQSPIAQIDIARAEALVRSAASFLDEAVDSVWQTVLTGDKVSLDQRVSARLAGAFAAEQACAAVDLCYKAGGGAAVYSTSPLQRCFRDVHTAAAHIMVSPRAYEVVGRHRVGLPIDTATI
jgi:indole-3-acetate monooxygenase